MYNVYILLKIQGFFSIRLFFFKQVDVKTPGFFEALIGDPEKMRLANGVANNRAVSSNYHT